MDAREAMEAVRDAVRAKARALARLDAMRAAEGLRGVSLGAIPPKGGTTDPMARTDARMDAERAATEELARLDATIAEGRAICRGVRAANPSHPWGDVLEARYVMDMPILSVASLYGISQRTVQTSASAAFDWIDSVGIARAREGRGAAE